MTTEPIDPYKIPVAFDVTNYRSKYNLELNVVLLWYPKNYEYPYVERIKMNTFTKNINNMINSNIHNNLDKIKDFNEIKRENLKHLVEEFNVYFAVFKFDEEKKIYVLIPDYYKKTKDYSVYINAFYNINKLFCELNVKANVYNLTDYYNNKLQREINYLHINLKNPRNSEILSKNGNNCVCIILGENKNLKIFGEEIIINDNDVKKVEENAVNAKHLIKELYFGSRANIKNKIEGEFLTRGVEADDTEKMINYMLKALNLDV